MSADRKKALLARPLEHIDVTCFDGRAVVDSYRNAAFQARNLAEAADIFAEMLDEPECAVILTLAGSLVSAGLKEALITLIECGMVDVIVSTGAVAVDQDFFEGLGFRHYMAPGSPEAPAVGDEELRALGIDRIYDTWIDEAELQHCDRVVAGIFDAMEARPWSSREVMRELGAYLARHHDDARSFLLSAYRREVPVFVPALSDSSAGFGAVAHRMKAAGLRVAPMAFDSAKDFHELALVKLAVAETGLLMVGGGVPKNFAQDAVVAAKLLAGGGWEAAGGIGTGAGDGDARFDVRVPMHRYAIQLTVADARDGGLSGSTLREATTWGKVDAARERMVFGEATVTFSLLVSDAYHRGRWRRRAGKRLNSVFDEAPARASPG